MTTQTHDDVNRRHDFIILFDVQDGNPNGDPDAGNQPRMDDENTQGLVTDVAIKRKVRDYVDTARGDEERFKIYVQSNHALNTQHQRAYKALDLTSTGTRQKADDVEMARQWMCENFFDIRMFGAVMTTGVNCGQVRGPIQITFARSLDDIMPMDVGITRIAVTRPEDMEVQIAEEGDNAGTGQGGKRSTMGNKYIVPYGLYRGYGFFNPHFARRTGADSDDLALFWNALVNMWDLDRSSSRGLMACRGLYVFSHDSPLGNAPAHRLFERLEVLRKDDIAVPRRFADYSVTLDEADLPAGVSVTRLDA